MDKELKSERFLKIYFDNNKSIFVDVNSNWEKTILRQRDKIKKVISNEWEWNLPNNEVIFR
jgi:hypothetical protein